LFQVAPGDVLRVFPVLIDRAVQDLAELRKPVERLGPDQRNGLVGREVATIVVDLDQGRAKGRPG